MDESAAGQRQIGVFLLDDHEIVRRGVKELLEAEPDIVVIGEAGTAESALARIPALKPDVAVLDVRLPDGDGVSVCRDIRSKMPEVACLMLTSFGDDEALFDAIMAGAAGYVLKQIRGTDLVGAVRTLAAGESILDPEAASRVMKRMRDQAAHSDPLTGLTAQEQRILELIGEGLTNRQIGERLFLAEKTVKNYVSALFAKLGMERRTQAAAFAARVFDEPGQRPQLASRFCLGSRPGSGTRQCSSVPPLSAGPTVSVPPYCSARWARLASPLRREVSVMPRAVVADEEAELAARSDAHLDAGGLPVAGRVRQGLAQSVQHVLADVRGDPVIQLASQPERGGHAHRPGHLLDHVHDLVAQAGSGLAAGLQGEDRLPDVVDRRVQVVDHAAHPLFGWRAVDQRDRALQLHPAGVKPLDDEVVQVPRDPVPVFEHRQPLRIAAPLSQFQRDRGLRRERRDQLGGSPRAEA